MAFTAKVFSSAFSSVDGHNFYVLFKASPVECLLRITSSMSWQVYYSCYVYIGAFQQLLCPMRISFQRYGFICIVGIWHIQWLSFLTGPFQVPHICIPPFDGFLGCILRETHHHTPLSPSERLDEDFCASLRCARDRNKKIDDRCLTTLLLKTARGHLLFFPAHARHF